MNRAGNDLQVRIAGQTDSVLVKSWYSSSAAKLEAIDTSDNKRLTGTQVDQLIQAMATFTGSTGLTWEQAAVQNNQQYLDLVAMYYNPQ